MLPIDLLKFMLPDFLVEHFEVVPTTHSEEVLHLYFQEKIKRIRCKSWGLGKNILPHKGSGSLIYSL